MSSTITLNLKKGDANLIVNPETSQFIEFNFNGKNIITPESNRSFRAMLNCYIAEQGNNINPPHVDSFCIRTAEETDFSIRRNKKGKDYYIKSIWVHDQEEPFLDSNQDIIQLKKTGYPTHEVINKFSIGKTGNPQIKTTLRNLTNKELRYKICWDLMCRHEGNFNKGIIYVDDNNTIGTLEEIMNRPESHCLFKQSNNIIYWNNQTETGFEIKSPRLIYCGIHTNRNSQLFTISLETNRLLFTPEEPMRFKNENSFNILQSLENVTYNVDIQPINNYQLLQ